MSTEVDPIIKKGDSTILSSEIPLVKSECMHYQLYRMIMSMILLALIAIIFTLCLEYWDFTKKTFGLTNNYTYESKGYVMCKSIYVTSPYDIDVEHIKLYFNEGSKSLGFSDFRISKNEKFGSMFSLDLKEERSISGIRIYGSVAGAEVYVRDETGIKTWQNPKPLSPNKVNDIQI